MHGIPRHVWILSGRSLKGIKRISTFFLKFSFDHDASRLHIFKMYPYFAFTQLQLFLRSIDATSRYDSTLSMPTPVLTLQYWCHLQAGSKVSMPLPSFTPQYWCHPQDWLRDICHLQDWLWSINATSRLSLQYWCNLYVWFCGISPLPGWTSHYRCHLYLT
jgi:hypothetical protein